MAGELFDAYPELCATADEILGYSIRELCLENPGGKLRHTAFTQPALFVAGALIWLDRTQREPPPDFVAGHSLGEYNALFAAGCFDFATGLRLVQRRGALMAEIEHGGMAAVLGLDAGKVQNVLRAEGADEGERAVDIANFNLPTQLVLSGPKAVLEGLVAPMEAAGARRCLLLNVSGAFHSRYMAATADAFASYLYRFRFEPPRIPVIANTTARPYGDDIAGPLVAQIRTSVRWSETMDYLLTQGVREASELGPGKVLRKLWASALEAAKPSEAGLAETAEPTTAPDTPPARIAADTTLATPASWTATTLGSSAFREAFGLRAAYVAGAPAPGIRGAEWVTNLAQAGLLGFLDPPGNDLETATQAIARVARELGTGDAFGVTLTGDEQLVDAALEHGVRFAETGGTQISTEISPALLRFRFRGAYLDAGGRPVALRRLLARAGRSSVAERWLKPAPDELIERLVRQGELDASEADVARRLPVCSDLCVVPELDEALPTLLPAVQRLRDRLAADLKLPQETVPQIGAGGALGTPEAIACAFLLGADFVETGAINLCTVEAAIAPAVKQLLAGLKLGDTTPAPALDGFALGTQTRVVGRGSLFAPRARKLYELFRFHDALEDLAPAQRETLEASYFGRSFEAIWDEIRGETSSSGVSPVDPKDRMARVFAWYLRQTLHWGLTGEPGRELSYQIPCDESLAAFNAWVADSPLAEPSARRVADLGQRLMDASASWLSRRLAAA